MYKCNTNESWSSKITGNNFRFIVETAISCNARLALVVYLQEYMSVEIKLNKFCKGLSPFFYSIGPFEGLKYDIKHDSNWGNPRGNPCDDVTSRPHVLRDAGFLQYVYKYK